MQTISMIAAVGKNNVIGHDGAIPWHLPADLAHFKKLTMGHPIIMGRRTFESIGKPLPGRQNMVITRQPDYHAGGVKVVHSLKEALQSAGDGEVFVIGGGEIYKEAFPFADIIYLTRVDAKFPGDAYFPAIDETEWITKEKTLGVRDEKNPYSYTFLTLERKS